MWAHRGPFVVYMWFECGIFDVFPNPNQTWPKMTLSWRNYYIPCLAGCPPGPPCPVPLTLRLRLLGEVPGQVVNGPVLVVRVVVVEGSRLPDCLIERLLHARQHVGSRLEKERAGLFFHSRYFQLPSWIWKDIETASQFFLNFLHDLRGILGVTSKFTGCSPICQQQAAATCSVICVHPTW